MKTETMGLHMYVERQEECHDFFSDTQQLITNQQLATKDNCILVKWGCSEQNTWNGNTTTSSKNVE
eukprot:10592894-Ditylum_brightwellii.AAC.1